MIIFFCKLMSGGPQKTKEEKKKKKKKRRLKLRFGGAGAGGRRLCATSIGNSSGKKEVHANHRHFSKPPGSFYLVNRFSCA